MSNFKEFASAITKESNKGNSWVERQEMRNEN